MINGGEFIAQYFFLLRSHTAAGTTISTTEAIFTSLKNDSSVDDIPKEKISGLRTESGRDGTREGLANETMKQGRNFSLDLLLVTACVYHGCNLTMVPSCVKFFGDGDIQNIKFLQSSCTLYIIQKWHDMNKFREVWKKVSNTPCGEKFRKPACARW